MPSLKESLKAKWGFVVAAAAAIAAAVAAFTPTTKDEELGQQYSPTFKAAWERGAELNGDVTPTTPPAH